MSNVGEEHWADDAELDAIPPLRDDDDRLNRDWIDQLVDLRSRGICRRCTHLM